MKPYLLFFVISINCFYSASSQSCFHQGITFQTQTEVDQFPIDNPDCKIIGGGVRILGDDITNLQGLSNLVRVRGLNLVEATALENLNGLENLTEIDLPLNIYGCSKLNDLSGLKNLHSVSGDVYITKCDSLKDLKGLSELSFIGGRLELSENPHLVNLSGLEKIQMLPQSVIISLNRNLTSLDGLNNLKSIGYQFEIKNNANLQKLQGLDNLESIDGSFIIEENFLLSSLDGLNRISKINSLRIFRNSILENLDRLERIDSTFFVYINFNDSLNNINGLQNLAFLSTLELTNNNNLQNIDGLQNLTRAVSLKINQNKNLKNIDGLKNLKEVPASLDISSNEKIENLNGLRQLQSIGHSLTIAYNKNLADISGITALNGLSWLTIKFNENLAICSNLPICLYLGESNGRFDIRFNKTGCNSSEEILADCINRYSGFECAAYYDTNQNSVFDPDEPFLPNFEVNINPGDLNFLTNNLDYNLLFVSIGDYEAILAPKPNWKTTTDPIINFSVDSSEVEKIEFGVIPSKFISSVIPQIYSQPFRCNSTINMIVDAENLGTTIADGTLWFEIDPNVEVVAYEIEPDQTNGNAVGWNFQSLLPGEEFERKVTLRIPGPLVLQEGTELNFESSVIYGDNINNNLTSNSNFSDVTRCSYDPNDKLVNPDRDLQIFEPVRFVDYTLFDEDITYTIRFQNTGNDVAFDVVIRDTLDENIDPATLQVLSSSHYELLNTSIENDRFITFEFKDIFLPDSSSNFSASQGYVAYLVKAKDSLAENTPINNTASIYFDLNPPIVTNTTENIMVSELPSVSTQNIDNQLNVNIFPNPTEGVITLSGNNLAKAKITLHSLTGKVLLSENLGANQQFHLPKGEKGMLILKIETEEGVAVKRIIKL